MNTAAYLTNQGWQGNGHALHHSGRGIKKPILISQKLNTFGIGKKKHDAHADQWWARAFDDTLKGLNTTTNVATSKKDETSLDAGAQASQTAVRAGAKWVIQGGLYRNFVQGESLSGTLPPAEKTVSESESQGTEQDVSGEKGTVLRQPRREKRRHRRKHRERTSEPCETPIIGSPGAKDDCDPSHGLRRDSLDPEAKAERRQKKKERRARKALRKQRKGGEIP